VLLTLLLLAPTLLHGRPFLFWDTAQYYAYGAKLAEFALKPGGGQPQGQLFPEAVAGSAAAGSTEAKPEGTGIAFYGARSPFYSAWLYVLLQTVGLWGAAVTQAAAIAWLVWRIAAQAAVADRLAWAVSAAALASLGTGGWFFIGFAMPDIYAAVALGALALLFAYADRMPLFERLGIATLLAASLTFHSTHLVTAVAVCPVAVLGAYLLGAKAPHLWRATLSAATALALAIALLMAFDVASRVALGASPKRPPFAMARVLADGPGRRYLESTCPRDNAFAVCAYRDRTFKTNDDFLWAGNPAVGVFSTLPLKERLRLIDEEWRFVLAVVMHDPVSVLGAAAGNAIRQFGLVWPAEAWIDPGQVFKDPPWRQERLLEAVPFVATCIDRPGSCALSFPEGLAFALCIVTVLAAFAVMAAHAIAAGRGGSAGGHGEDGAHRRALIFGLVVVLGLVANAALCGAVSGTHTRYQARVVWLAVIAALVLEAARPIVACRIGLYARRLRYGRRGQPSGEAVRP
jgi:hypothetical protein